MHIPLKTLLCSILVVAASAAESIGPLELRSQTTSGSDGVLLSDLVLIRPELALPRVVLASAPPIGRPYFITRAQVNDLLAKKAPDLVCTNWSGADRVKVSRATRILTQGALSELLTKTLQDDTVKDRGELELWFSRPWNNLVLPDEPISLKILELPNAGVTPNFICRFELLAGGESAGVYQAVLQAKVWKNVYAAHSNVLRGQLLREADLALEKRDILTTREYLTALPLDDPYIEFRENVPAGTVISSRALRLRAIIKRGRQVEAMFQDDSMQISVRAEALEDGVPGQIVRVRNVQSRKEFRGKVQDEQTVLVLF